MTTGEGASTNDEHRPGDTLGGGRFAITGKLGEGGQGTTFDGIDKRDGRRVTLKRFRVRGASSWKEVELAEREAKVLAHVDHPHLPVYRSANAIASGRLSVGAVPGFASLATTMRIPAWRSAATGGGA